MEEDKIRPAKPDTSLLKSGQEGKRDVMVRGDGSQRLVPTPEKDILARFPKSSSIVGESDRTYTVQLPDGSQTVVAKPDKTA